MLTSCNAKKSCFVISFIGFNFILQESRELIYRKKDDFTGFFHSSKVRCAFFNILLCYHTTELGPIQKQGAKCSNTI